MAEAYELNALNKAEHGKAASRRMRRLDDRFPAVVYGAGKENQNISLDHKAIMHASEHESFYSSILTLDIDGKKQKVVIKAVQRHPSKPRIMHMDFLRVSATEKLTMTVPLHFLNQETAPGVKEQGGVVSHNISDLEIKCLPADLPEFIEVDVAQLKLNETIHLSEIKLPKGVELAHAIEDDEHDHAVVTINVPRVEEESEKTEETGEEGESAEAEGKEKPAEGDPSDDKSDDTKE